jgi:hypothetical protein
MRSRGSRHGRQLRNYVLAGLGRRPYGSFADVVAETCDFLREEWPDELGKLRWQILDAPAGVVDGKVPRWRSDPQEMRITIYRIPIQRQTHTRRPDYLDERFHTEQYVFFAVGELIGRDPWELMPDRFKD